jgi:tetratricopeptide (TPR) repeat protein
MSRMVRRWLLMLALAAMAVSCQSSPRDGGPAGERSAGRALSGDDVPAPPGVDAASVMRRRGEALERAKTSLDEIVAQLPVPTYLQPTDPSARPAPSTDDIPLAVQRAYLEGRQAWRDGRNFDAVQALQRAQRLAPNSPHILRLLGKIYANSGNLVRGAQLLEQSIRIDPDDLESLVLLAMYAQDQGRFNDAIVTFTRARRMAEADKTADPAIRPLVHFYLGNAMEREGYDAAAIEQYRLYLDLPRHFSRSTAMVRQLAFLYGQRSATWQTVGDLHNRLDQTEQALAAYQKAMELGAADPVNVMVRAMYTHLRRGEAAAARDAAMQVVRQMPDEPRTMSMLRYLTEVGATTTAFAQQLEEMYRTRGRPGSLALTIAAMLPPDRSAALLRDHLAAKPGDADIYRQLIASQWNGKAAQTAGAAAAIRTTLATITQHPASAREYAEALLAIAESPAVLVERIDALPDAERQPAAARYLRGSTLLRARRPDEAMTDLRAAIDGDARLTDARVELAGLLINRGQLDAAAAMLDELGESADSDVIGLRVRVLAETGRHADALALLERQLTTDPTNLDLVMDKAALQLRMNDPAGAERTLQDALNLQPTAERLYEALFNLYNSQAALPDAVRQYQRLLRRAFSTIPNSRIARLQRAKLHDARGEFREAEQLLRGLMDEQPDDLAAVDTLLDVLVRADRRGEADVLIERRIDEAKDNGDLLRIAHRHYTRTNNPAKANEVFERLLQLEPEGEQKARALAVVYLNSGRPNEAMDALLAAIDGPIEQPGGWVSILGRAANRAGRIAEADPHIRRLLERFPDHDADLHFEWAMVLDRRGDKAGSEQVMLDLLKRHPDHAPTNNSLGYTWANEGRHLDRAHELIQVAVDADPNAAYLDSMGWVLYKKGRFEEAAQWLRRGKNEPGGDYPVIIDHLGDALYRLNRRGEAVREWRAALQSLSTTRETPEDDPELEGMAQRIQAKLDAVQQNQPAPVAPVPGMEADAAAPAE